MKFSVLIAVYKKENPSNFDVALDSLVNQTLMPNEIVLVKDGPLTVELEAVLNKYLSSFPDLFHIVPLPQNQGLGNALKIGLAQCQFDYVARMDSDDICIENRFKMQIDFLKQHPEIDVLGTGVEEFNHQPGDLKTFRILPSGGQALRRYAKFRSPVNHPSIIFKKSKVLESGGYTSDILLFEDFTLFVRMLKHGAIFYNMPEVLLHFRIGDGIETIKRRSGLHYAKKELQFLKFAKRIGHLNLPETLFYLFTKIPLRVLPPKLVLFIYNFFLRQKM